MNLEKFKNKNRLNRSPNVENIKILPRRDFENGKKKDRGIFLEYSKIQTSVDSETWMNFWILEEQKIFLDCS